MIYATQNQNIFENFCSRPVWTIRKFYLSFAKHLTMKQITDKSISPPINYMISYGKESKTSATETAGDDAGQISACAEIRRVSELLAMAINGRQAKVSNNTV